MRMRSPLSIAAALALALASTGASAQQWSVDTKALDTGGAAAQPKPKKAKQTAGRPDNSGKSDGKTENRQFGELEGWSPGKAPPKKKDEEKESRFGTKMPVNVTPSGGMSVGMPF